MMSNQWEIIVEWVELSSGTPEERATACYLGLKANDLWLTRGHDVFTDAVQHAPILSAYYLAEWFAWNWWRLRWEPLQESEDWPSSHKIASIGHGYVWPDIEFISDGHSIRLITRQTPKWESYTYLTDFDGKIDAAQFESVIDVFISKVLARLEEHHIKDSNLHTIWTSKEAERNDPALSEIRKREALLGMEPIR